MQVDIKGTDEMVQSKLDEANELMLTEPQITSGLHSHIIAVFQENKDARENSGVNKIMLDSLRAYNGNYSSNEMAAILEEGGSTIFMNLTSHKCRIAASWIKDIELNDEVISIEPTPLPELPRDITDRISQAVEVEFQASLENSEDTTQTIKEINEFKRDMADAILEELNSEARYAFKHIETKIKDQMFEGGWKKALSDFIENFCIFPTAIMKGPIVTKSIKLTWENGVAVEKPIYSFVSKNISPLDMYPSPESESCQDGNLIEHIRLSEVELDGLKKQGAPYDSDKITKVLEQEQGKGESNLDGSIEDEKSGEELRDNQHAANKNVYHGLHFYGPIKASMLRQWGLPLGVDVEDTDILEAEAILIGSEVIMAKLNKDPLKRRPYFSASYQSRPNSFWGTSLPAAMAPVQKMCNGCARALSNNMALASGPIMEVYVDRLADDGDVEEISPRKVIQVVSDPMGAGGRALQFIDVPSNAAELLKVYEFYEARADDVTLIPKHSNMNEKAGGAAQTATGLSMLLEAASKGIKDCIRAIDYGVIIPRIEYEFYHLMLGGGIPFSGDISVIARGSQSLTNRASEALKRQEFLRVMTMPAVLELIGKEGVSNLVREMGDEMGFISNIVPSRQEIKLKEKENAERQAAAQKAEAESKLAPALAQINGQKEMHNQTMQLKGAELQSNQELELAKLQVKDQAENLRTQSNIQRDQTSLERAAMDNSAKIEMQSKEIAVSLRGEGTGDRDKIN